MGSPATMFGRCMPGRDALVAPGPTAAASLPYALQHHSAVLVHAQPRPLPRFFPSQMYSMLQALQRCSGPLPVTCPAHLVRRVPPRQHRKGTPPVQEQLPVLAAVQLVPDLAAGPVPHLAPWLEKLRVRPARRRSRRIDFQVAGRTAAVWLLQLGCLGPQQPPRSKACIRHTWSGIQNRRPLSDCHDCTLFLSRFQGF